MIRRQRLAALLIGPGMFAAMAMGQQPGSVPVMPGAHAPAGPGAAIPGVRGPALRVAVSIAPLEGLVKPLLPEGSSVTVLVPPGRSEHGYEFTPAELAALAQADLVVYVGLNLEPKVAAIIERHDSPGQRVVCFAEAAGIRDEAGGAGREGPGGHAHEGHEGHGGEEEDGRIDPHLWLDPSLCEKLVPSVAAQVKAGLAAKGAGDAAGTVDAAAAAMEAKIRETDEAWRAALAPFAGRAIVTHHDAFSRPAERYGLKVAAVVRPIETADPSPAQLVGVIEAIRREHVLTLFVEPQFNAKAAERIGQAAQINIAKLDPLGDGDWFKMMKGNLEALTNGLGEK
ncbi:MAG: hypothetical protein GC200_05165 [Tepidisphaera sp.]|nr:hypothetical protein [Tepidisphaera sp.]